MAESAQQAGPSGTTPGPWITQRGAGRIWIGSPKPWAPDDLYSIVAAVEGGGNEYNDATNARAEANARLIASAPALYAALREIHRWAGDEAREFDSSRCRWIEEAARAALAAATGEPQEGSAAPQTGEVR